MRARPRGEAARGLGAASVPPLPQYTSMAGACERTPAACARS
jgi:hypothetical protein